MKFKLILFSLLLIFTVASAQDVEGDWYTPHRNKLINVRISNDSIIIQKCSFDFEDHDYSEMAGKISKREGSTYIVAIKKGEQVKFTLFGFRTEKGKNMMNAASFNELFESPEEAEKNIVTLQNETVEITLLSKAAIEKIAKQRDINTMTAEDFKKYAQKIIGIDSANTAFYPKKYKLAYLYGQSTGRLVLSDIGINSLVKGQVFDDMISRFAEVPETKELFLQMTKRK